MCRLLLLGLVAACAEDPVLPEPTPIAGDWALTWTCVDGCDPGNVNPLELDDRVVVTATAAAFHGDACPDCNVEHEGWMSDACLVVPEGDDFGITRDEYQLCAWDGALTAQITWSGFPGPEAPRTWRLDGEPR